MFDRGYAPNIYQLCNDLDRGLGELTADLKASGDFASTLIVMMGEFGRTPGMLNARGGRDHHKFGMSVCDARRRRQRRAGDRRERLARATA